MSIIEKTEKVYSGPEKSVYPQIGTLFAGDSFQYKNAAGQVSFDISNTPRNYTGPEANWCKESEALKAFIDSHKSENGVNVFIDTHGYTTQIITSASARDSSNPTFNEKMAPHWRCHPFI